MGNAVTTVKNYIKNTNNYINNYIKNTNYYMKKVLFTTTISNKKHYVQDYSIVTCYQIEINPYNNIVKIHDYIILGIVDDTYIVAENNINNRGKICIMNRLTDEIVVTLFDTDTIKLCNSKMNNNYVGCCKAISYHRLPNCRTTECNQKNDRLICYLYDGTEIVYDISNVHALKEIYRYKDYGKLVICDDTIIKYRVDGFINFGEKWIKFCDESIDKFWYIGKNKFIVTDICKRVIKIIEKQVIKNHQDNPISEAPNDLQCQQVDLNIIESIEIKQEDKLILDGNFIHIMNYQNNEIKTYDIFKNYLGNTKVQKIHAPEFKTEFDNSLIDVSCNDNNIFIYTHNGIYITETKDGISNTTKIHSLKIHAVEISKYYTLIICADGILNYISLDLMSLMLFNHDSKHLQLINECAPFVRTNCIEYMYYHLIHNRQLNDEILKKFEDVNYFIKDISKIILSYCF